MWGFKFTPKVVFCYMSCAVCFLVLIHPVQEVYSQDQRVWNSIFRMVSEDLAQAEINGIRVKDTVFWPIILGNKGDWSYLVPWP